MTNAFPPYQDLTSPIMGQNSKSNQRRKPDLSADKIAREAFALVGDEGSEACSFRRLSKRLNCEAMHI